MRKLQLTGQRFGHLVVYAQALNCPRGSTWWRCHCDCGNDCIKAGKDLKKQTDAKWIHSCGCRGQLAHSVNYNRVNHRNDKLRALRGGV